MEVSAEMGEVLHHCAALHHNYDQPVGSIETDYRNKMNGTVLPCCSRILAVSISRDLRALGGIGSEKHFQYMHS